MPSEVINVFAQTIANGLRRKSIVSCSRWAEKFRVMGKPFPGPYSFKYFPWAKEMHDCEDEKWVGQKSAQVGYTEVALDRVFYTIDIKRVDCLYLLPSQNPDASNFSAGRFDPALEMSPYLNDLFSDVKNVGHKRAGSTNLYIRGTRSRSQLKSIPSGLIVFDELDEMTQKNLSLAEERQAGQTSYQQIKISTPTIAGTGINLEFIDSLQDHFYFPCPKCSRWTELIFPDCVVITADDIHDQDINRSHLICKECKGELSHQTKFEWLAKGQWFPTRKDGNYHGWHINGLYSSAAKRHPVEIALKFLKAKSDPSEEQEFYNSILGDVHEVKGARITELDIIECARDYILRPVIQSGTLTTLGIDQGTQLHYEVDAWYPKGSNSNGNGSDSSSSSAFSTDINNNYRPKLLDAGALLSFNDLDLLMKKWQIKGCVIDANPEKRMALDFASRFPGFVYLCIYGEGVKSRNINVWSNEPTITVDRTAWMDIALGRFRASLITIPSNIPPDYKAHLKTPVRVPDKDRNGNPLARYVTPDRVADHYAHARTYSEIALSLAVSGAKNTSIVSPR